MSTTNVTRVATTITNVKAGTFGAQFPHQFAILDLIDTFEKQIDAIRDEGNLDHRQAFELKQKLWAINKVTWAPVDKEIDRRSAAAAERLATLRAAR